MVSPLSSPLRIAALLALLTLVLAGCAAERPGEGADAEPEATEAVEATDGETPPVEEAMTVTDGPAPTEDATAEDATEAEADGPPANLTAGCATEDLDIDWFPEKVTFDRASGIRVTYDGNVKLVEIDQPNDQATEGFTLALVQCGTTAPEDLDADAVVEVPVRAAATYSTTFLQGFDLIGRVDALVAHGGLQFASTQSVLDAAAAGDIVEVGDQTAPDLEALAAADPDVVLVSAGFSGADPTEPFAALPIPVVPNASYLETDPVGRAEWMKLEALLLNEEAAVEAVFEQVAADYDDLVAQVEGVEARPLVLTNAPFEGTWFASGGDSYTADLLADAGATYVFADEPGSTLALDLEAVLAVGQDADVWLSAGSVAQTPEEFAATDERLASFAAFPDATYANDADLGPNGGNRFFEDGAVRPDLVLADLVHILHPELLPDHELRFFGLIGSEAGSGASPGNSG